MKSQNKESGSVVHIIVIVILVVAVLGLLGFVFWQNFINKKPHSGNTATNSSAKVDTSTSPLIVKEWGVKADIGSTDGITYHIVPEEDGTLSYESIYFQPKGLPADCAPANIDEVVRLTADQQVPDGNLDQPLTAKQALDNNTYIGSQIGQYYYIYLREPGGVCGDDAVLAAQITARDIAISFAQNVTAD